MPKSKKNDSKRCDDKPRAYQSKWENEDWAQGWLSKSKGEDPFKQAFCLVCKKDYRAHYKDLNKHSGTESHKMKMDSIGSKQPKISQTFTANSKDEDKVRDLRLAVFIACHSSIRSSDHLCEILKNLKFKDLKLHKTKCGNLIKCVVAPNLLLELVEDIGDMPYSLIADESTDSSKVKYLCLCIRYYSNKHNRFLTDFLGLISIDKADADTLYTLVTNFLDEIKIPVSNLIGLGTDGGSNMCGKNHSLFTLLKSKVPKLQLVRCICHSLNLAASVAADEFPASVEFLLREVYNWFSNSPKRKAEYEVLWNTLNTLSEDSDEQPKDFHRFVKLSTTRWLARYNAIKVIMEHFFELQTHFAIVISTEKCYTARLLNEMLHDMSNYLYLTIVKPILYEVNDVNITFQRETADVSCAYDDLKDLITLLAQKILKPDRFSADLQIIIEAILDESAYVSIENAQYGIEYKAALLDHPVDNDVRHNIETRAFNYMKKLCIQLATRLPENIKHFEKLKMSPSVCLTQLRPKFTELPFLDVFMNKSKLGLAN